MSIIVQKFGGTSVADSACLQRVAERVMQTRAQGHDVVVVVSAMGSETDRLIDLIHEVTEHPSPREMDLVLSTGEQVSASLLSLVLASKGCASQAYLGWQAGIQTNHAHGKARILDVDIQRLQHALQAGMVPVVAGFQGIHAAEEITTLGRGGSDTTAVALAVALAADACQIYTDVDGVYTADPRIVSSARLLTQLTFEEMLELASLGAKVLQIRSVAFASKYNMPIQVLSSFTASPGTLITEEDNKMEQALVSGVTYDKNQARLTILGILYHSRAAEKIFQALQGAQIVVDMIVQTPPSTEGLVDISFTVPQEDYPSAYKILKNLAKSLKSKGVMGDDRVAKLSIVGVGMRSHLGVATRMFSSLGEEGIDILLVSTSEIKVSVLVQEKYVELGMRTLHTVFCLDQESGIEAVDE